MLTAKGLQRSYGDVQVLYHVNLEVTPGTIVGMVGNNGTGKTTTLKILSGILDPDVGTVRLNGQDPRIPATRKQLGFLPESSPLYPERTPKQLLQFFGSLHGLSRKVIQQRGEVLLTALRLPKEMWSRPAGKLSKGSARKVAIAIALLHDPDVVILDEPTSGLDPQSRDDVDNLLKQLRERGKAILLSAHDLSQVERLCDHVYLMHKGRIQLEGSVQELRQRHVTVYQLHATTTFYGATQDGPVFVGEFESLDAVDQAMAQVREHGGSILKMASLEPSLADIYRGAL